MEFRYKPFEERTPDVQYQMLLRRIIEEGEWVTTQMEERALYVLGHMMRFDLSNGFPLLTVRDLVDGDNRSTFYQALGELFGFLNGARTQEELETFGCSWWKPWVSERKCSKRGLQTGDLGDGSYGAAWAAFPTAEGLSFDQIQHVVEQIRELPHLLTHVVTPFIPQYLGRGVGKQQKVVVVPCHGFLHIVVNTETNELSVHHFQRSADVPVGLAGNLIQYAALTLMLGQVTGYKPRELVNTISHAHVYERQLDDVRDLLATNPQRFPVVTVDSSVSDLRSFRQHHFTVSDYHPQLARRRVSTPV